MRSLRLPLVFLVPSLAFASPALAQDDDDTSGVLDVSERFEVSVLDSTGLGPILYATGAIVIDSIDDEDSYLLESSSLYSQSILDLLLETATEMPLTDEADYGKTIQTPEADGCRMAGYTKPSSQQCTIAFYDGSPTIAEFEDQPAVAQMGIKGAQAFAQTYQPVVAVIDTGIDPLHPVFAGTLHAPGKDFINKIMTGYDQPNGLDDDEDGFIDEAVGHGSHVASSILLVNPSARILPLRVLDSDGNGKSFHVAKAIKYAIKEGADVINLSLSMGASSKAVTKALKRAKKKGVLVVTSAGNTGMEYVLYPGDSTLKKATKGKSRGKGKGKDDDKDGDGSTADADDDTVEKPFKPASWSKNVLTVSSVDNNDMWATFAAYGSAVEVVAPGVNIYGAVYGGGHAWWSGTSASAGLASGAASLLYTVADGPCVDAIQVLMDTAVDVDALNPLQAGKLGSGRLDVYTAALSIVQP